MTIRAVFFDVGETLVDEERYWREIARVAGVGPHVLWAALGTTIERGEEHWKLWRHLGLERPAAADAAVYADEDLYPDARDALAHVRSCGMLVGVAGNQSAALERWANTASLPVDIVKADNDVAPALAAGLTAFHLKRGRWGRLQATPAGATALASLAELVPLLVSAPAAGA